jgi:hypothetical protein
MGTSSPEIAAEIARSFVLVSEEPISTGRTPFNRSVQE